VTGVSQSRAGPCVALPPSRLDVTDALPICLAMVDDDRSAYHAAARMWQALAPFVPALTQVESDVALEALEALAGPDARSHLRRLRGRAACHGFAGLASVLDEWT
jgi:ferric-dicitrate binding protein FerR (iron transport regulator)